MQRLLLSIASTNFNVKCAIHENWLHPELLTQKNVCLGLHFAAEPHQSKPSQISTIHSLLLSIFVSNFICPFPEPFVSFGNFCHISFQLKFIYQLKMDENIPQSEDFKCDAFNIEITQCLITLCVADIVLGGLRRIRNCNPLLPIFIFILELLRWVGNLRECKFEMSLQEFTPYMERAAANATSREPYVKYNEHGIVITVLLILSFICNLGLQMRKRRIGEVFIVWVLLLVMAILPICLHMDPMKLDILQYFIARGKVLEFNSEIAGEMFAALERRAIWILLIAFPTWFELKEERPDGQFWRTYPAISYLFMLIGLVVYQVEYFCFYSVITTEDKLKAFDRFLSGMTGAPCVLKSWIW